MELTVIMQCSAAYCNQYKVSREQGKVVVVPIIIKKKLRKIRLNTIIVHIITMLICCCRATTASGCSQRFRCLHRKSWR